MTDAERAGMSDLTRFSVPPLWEVTGHLAGVASERISPDSILTGARVLSVYTERILHDREIWISRGRVAAVKPAGAGKKAFPAVPGYDVQGGLLAPGLVDAHVHIESSMMTACAYAEVALRNGTTTIFCDSHEIGNVCDADGVEWMLEDARRAPLNIFLTVPSTVPAGGAELETAGGDLTADKIGALFDRWPEAVALGEKMDFIDVVMGNPRSHAILAAALRRGRPVCGHIYGREFVAAYAASGVTDTHEAIDREIASDLLEAGIWVFLRGGNQATPWNSLPQAIRAITELGANPKRVCLCTDDRDADDLFTFGLDWVARSAVQAGLSPVTAWSCGSLHPATRYGMDGELGALGHSRRADIVLLDDSLGVRHTWFGGQLVVEEGKTTTLLDAAWEKRYRYPAAAYRTVTLSKRLILIPPLPPVDAITNVIGLDGTNIPTRHRRLALGAFSQWDEVLGKNDLCFLTVLERHGKAGNVGYGLLGNFGLRAGAVASTVGHDAHNLIVAGTNEGDMRVAMDRLEASQGGICLVRDGKVIAAVDLPIAGLLSDERAAAVAERTAAFKQAWEEAGCRLPYMGFNLLPLSVIPEIRLTDKGLVLCPAMRNLPLFENT